MSFNLTPKGIVDGVFDVVTAVTPGLRNIDNVDKQIIQDLIALRYTKEQITNFTKVMMDQVESHCDSITIALNMVKEMTDKQSKTGTKKAT